MSSSHGSKKARLYFAAPLFSEAERQFNAVLADKLRTPFDVYLPQDDGGLVSEMVKRGTDFNDAFVTVFNLDVIEIRKCDVFLILLDGRAVDEGAAFELGYATAIGKMCIGLQTDPRRAIGSRNNPMIDCALEYVFTSVDALVEWSNEFVNQNSVAATNHHLDRGPHVR